MFINFLDVGCNNLHQTRIKLYSLLVFSLVLFGLRIAVIKEEEGAYRPCLGTSIRLDWKSH